MRRMIIALTAATLATATGPGWAQDSEKSGGELCQEYCGEKAAERCEDINSLRCGAYIMGCLAGCNLKQL